MEQNIPVGMATILRKTSLNEPLVFVCMAVIAVAVIASLNRNVRVAAHTKVFWGLVGAILIAWTGLFFFRIEMLDAFSGEGHIIEWLTAHMLLILGVVGVLMMFRQRARGRPYPLAVFLTTGCLVGFCRELQWGEPFFGEKIIYTRYMWRPAAYFGPSRFRGLASEPEMIERGITAQFLYVSFLLFMAFIIVVGAVTITYIVRHRKAFVEQLQEFIKGPAGRFFIAGMGLYVAGQLVGELVEEIMEDQLAAMGTSYCIMAEPLELIASMLLLRSMVRLWHMERCYLPAAVLRERTAASRAVLAAERATAQTHHVGATG